MRVRQAHSFLNIRLWIRKGMSRLGAAFTAGSFDEVSHAVLCVLSCNVLYSTLVTPLVLWWGCDACSISVEEVSGV